MLNRLQRYINYLFGFVIIIKAIISRKIKFEKHKEFNRDNDLLIIGNGPSLNDSLKNNKEMFYLHDIMCMNHFPQTDLFVEIKPLYLVVLDPNFGKKDSDDIDNVNKTIMKIDTTVTWNLCILLPASLEKFNHFQAIKNKYIHLCYYNSITFKSIPKSIERCLVLRGICFPQSCGMTVMHSAILNGILLGYKKILLVGADHSWHELYKIDQETNEIYINNDEWHFYSNDEKKKIIQKVKISQLFGSLQKVFSGYEEISDIAKMKDVKIINKSDKSWIDSFVRIDQ